MAVSVVAARSAGRSRRAAVMRAVISLLENR